MDSPIYIMLKDLKYIIAYLTPASAFIAVTWQGGWSFSTVIIAFIIVPIIEQFAKGTERNLSAKEEEKKENAYFFDLLLYLNLPILYIILWCYFSAITNDPLTVWETVGVTMSVGVTLGGVGINVAHELGHRKKWYEQWMAKTLLTAALYTQFYIEHNRGHHLWVATDEDPSSARQGESLYQFWVRSIIGVYTHAWQLENGRLKKMGKSPFSLSNEMFWLQTAHLSYLIAVWSFFGWTGVAFAVVVATLAILQLETVNYIE
ncbi:MAG: fatty acid desaturase, partial [Saprospiraceae bacterium]